MLAYYVVSNFVEVLKALLYLAELMNGVKDIVSVLLAALDLGMHCLYHRLQLSHHVQLISAVLLYRILS